jgi:hypothetical protein
VGVIATWNKLVREATRVPFARISIDAAVGHGQACVKGTRIPVHQIVHMLANQVTPIAAANRRSADQGLADAGQTVLFGDAAC